MKNRIKEPLPIVVRGDDDDDGSGPDHDDYGSESSP